MEKALLLDLTQLLLGLPLLMFLILGLLGKYLKPNIAGIIGTLSLSVMTILAYFIAYNYFFVIGQTSGSYVAITEVFYHWLQFTDKLALDVGVLLDPISVLMLVVITTISLMVHVYSIGYMHGEKGFQRYYAFLSLFTFSMLGLVVATNVFQMYAFWELVGVSSFLLISFYYMKPSAVAAAKKAFIVTRFADFFFLLGILLISYYAESFQFDVLNDYNAPFVQTMQGMSFMGLSVMSWALLLIFMGGAGKSAMMPFHIWLPDAMEGPTPASALIHAATMVVSGVFLVARLFPIYYFGAPDILELIGWIGAITAIFSAIVACTQTDIKRVLAFSTISQIAFMITALGVSKYDGHDGIGYVGSLYHLFTHAFFKALLFLGAGSIIHAVHSNEMKDMGGLSKYMPITRWTFLIACIAIAGIFPLSGFWSKDEILVAAYEGNKAIYFILSFAATLTAFYMFRLYFRIFHYENKGYDPQHKPHESPMIMTIPLMILALFSAFVGFLFSAMGPADLNFSRLISADRVGFGMHIDVTIAAVSTGLSVLGIVVAYILYAKKNNLPDKISSAFGKLYVWACNKFYFDELWLFVTRKIIFNCISRPIAWFDKTFVDGFMDAIAAVTQTVSEQIKGLQSGRLQQYLFVYLLGGLILVIGFCGWLVAFILK